MLRRIDPIELHLVWPFVIPGLERVRRHSDGTWLPEDVYAAIRSGHSELHMAPDGFVVLTPSVAFDGRALHVWCAYCTGGNTVARYLPRIEEIALAQGARRITFWSPRKWERHIAKHGFTPVQVEYRKELR